MTRPWLGLVVIGLMFAFTLVVFYLLPAEIATHWNLRGEVDVVAPRSSGAFIGPAVTLAIWMLLRLLPKIDPRRAHYRRFWDTYWIFANLVVLVMAVLHIAVLGYALGWPLDVTRVVVATMGLMFVALGYHLPRVRSNWWLGIRTPWTLENERVWRETHRLAGRTFILGGAIMLTAAALPESVRPWMAMAGIAVGGIVPVVYSYLVWRRERRERRA